jgi:hypothetical protein
VAKPVVNAGGLLKTLLSLVTKLGQERRPGLSALSRLATKKFSELEKTHILFLFILKALQDDLEILNKGGRRGQKSIGAPKLLKGLEAALNGAESLRRKDVAKRRASYEEAKVYSQQGFEDKASIILPVPSDVLDHLREFMSSYCSYFETEGRYDHNVQDALDAVKATLALANSRMARSGEIDLRTSDLLKKNLGELTRAIELAMDDLGQRWARLASDYHRTIHSLRENGCPIQ